MVSNKDTKTTREVESEKPVPTVDPNATLEIEKITKSPDIPTVDKNAPLKVEEVEEEEEDRVQEKSNQKLFILGGVGLGIIIIATAAFFIFSSRQQGIEETAEEKVDVTPTPTQTPKAVLKREEWSFEVLNGSGVAGVAKKMADQLIELGYQVVKVGNADKQTYEVNQLFISKELEDKTDLLIADLKDTIKIATVAGELKDSTASARIILGGDQ